MKILVLNSGSSSLKYQLFFMDKSQVLASGLVERIGEIKSRVVYKRSALQKEFSTEIPDHKTAIQTIMEILVKKDVGVIADKSEITAIGHRVVHGGEKFQKPTIIDDQVIAAIQQNIPLAPLHNPANLTGIQACQEFFSGTKQVAIFDTAFHQTMPPHAFHYAIDKTLYSEHRVRRYGFHGTSHRYVSERARDFLQKPADDVHLITIHLGNGCSMAAIQNGKCIDTSMGMTPLEGMVMGTRSGDLDAGIIFYLSRELGYTVDQMDTLLNKNSGLKGLANTNDMRDLLNKKQNGDEAAELAFQVYCYRIKKYIGAYAAALGKLDAIVFTGGIGENSQDVRAQILANLQILGIDLDKDKNSQNSGKERAIQTDEEETAILIIPTNEELQIARETFDLVK